MIDAAPRGRVIDFDDPAEFRRRAGPMLLQHEAENNVILGVTGRLPDGPSSEALMCAIVEPDGDVVAAAVMTTPPGKVLLTRMSPPQAETLVDHVRRSGRAVQGAVGPLEAVECFAGVWARRAAVAAERTFSMRIYQLDRVVPAERAGGTLRPPRPEERDLLTRWMIAFNDEIREPRHDLQNALDERLAEGSLVFWESQGRPVSMAGWAGPTPSGIRINAVYTPPEFRRRGYAGACVAALSQSLLDAGRRFCFLYTDQSNPTSNGIYQRIGYRPVCNCASYNFGARSSS